MAYSDKVSKIIGKSIIHKKVNSEEMNLIETEYYERFNKKTGCIMDNKYCPSLVDDIINFLR